ncbi:MAG: hypothetical protein IPN29_08505 [Saprospiraceae bacterium]|nr:hypothetical protein [Saprospiraceae bacterium]
MRIAAVDLGSNTFHLLIVETTGRAPLVEIFRERVFVGLGDGGIELLEEEAIERGLQACSSFRKAMDFYTVNKVRVTGTAALRVAQNSLVFRERAESILGVGIDVIDGIEEARLIFEGVKLLSALDEPALLVDIGGGSTEFIIVQNGHLKWSGSYKLGVGVMHAAYHLNEPIGLDQEMKLREHIKLTLSPLQEAIIKMPVDILIGASGSFEVLESMSGQRSKRDELNEIKPDKVRNMVQTIIHSDLNQRILLPGMPAQRVKLIVVAMILIDEILNFTGKVRIQVTPYALKEGVIAEFVRKWENG